VAKIALDRGCKKELNSEAHERMEDLSKKKPTK
jgi:hypothetical protein